MEDSERLDQNLVQNQRSSYDNLQGTQEEKKEYTESELKEHKKNFGSSVFKTCYVSICFMLLFSAFNSAQNMVSTVYSNLGYGNLGNIALFSLYFAFAICSFFGAQIVSIAPPRIIFFLSGICYNCFMLAGLIVVHCPDREDDLPWQCQKPVLYSYIIFASVLCGIAAAPIWVQQGGYIEAISTQCPSRSGTFVGIFWALMQVSQIFGNTMSYFLLGMENGTIKYFNTMLAIGLIGNVMFLFLPAVKGKTEKKKATPKISRMIKLIKTPEIRPLSFLMAFTGIIIAFYSGFLYRLVQNSLTQEERDDEEISNKKTSAVYIALGCAEVISGLISGQLTQKFNLYNLATIGTLIAELGLVLSLLGYYLEKYGLIFGIAAVWGFCDSYFNVFVQEICNRDYPEYIEIFALFRLVLALANSFTQVLALTIDQDWVFILIIIAFQMATNIATKLLKKPDMSKLIDNSEIQGSELRENSEKIE